MRLNKLYIILSIILLALPMVFADNFVLKDSYYLGDTNGYIASRTGGGQDDAFMIFETTSAYKLSKFGMRFKDAGSVGTKLCSFTLHDVVANYPSGVALDYAGTFDFDVITGNYLFYNVTFRNYSLTSGTKYAVVINCTGGDSSNFPYYNYNADSSGNYVDTGTWTSPNWAGFGGLYVQGTADFEAYEEGGIGNLNPINVTITYPEDNYGFNASKLTDIGHNVWINASFNQSNVTCFHNDTTNFGIITYNTTVEGDGYAKAYMKNTTALSDGIYNVYVQCNDTNVLVNGSYNISFRLDINSPVISGDYDLINNKKVVWNQTLTGQLNFTDNLEIYSINATFYNGTTLYYGSNLGQNNYQLNLSYRVDTTVLNNFTVKVCDAHTAQTISDVDRIDIENKGLKYVIEDKPLWLQDKWVSIYPKDSLSYTNTPVTSKLSDRYSFTFDKLIAASPSETFVVESTDYIDISKAQNYKGHLIIPNLNRWIDFENPASTKTEIKRISDTKVEVIVYGLKSSKITFNSIGELNCVEQLIKYTNANLNFTNASSTITNDETEFTVTYYESDTSEEILVDFFYNNTEINLTKDNFVNYGAYYRFTQTATVTTPTGIVGNSSLIPFNWNFTTLYDDNYNVSGSHNVSTFNIDNCTIYTTPAINFTSYNITDGTLLNTSLRYYFDYYMNDIHKNYSTSAININTKTFCIYPPNLGIYADITIEYGIGEAYNFNYYSLGTLLNSTVQYIPLYTTDETTLTKFTVTDNIGTKIPNVYISVLRWDAGTGTFQQQSVLKTDYNGEAIGYINLYNTWYKFILTYEGVVYLDTEPAKVSSNLVNFVINFQSDYYAAGVTSLNMYSALSFSNTTKIFTNTYANKPATASEVCLSVEQQTLNGVVFINESCGTTDAGSLTVNIGATPTGTYTATSYAVIDEKDLNLKTLSVDFDYTWKTFGLAGIFVSFLLITALALLGLWNIAAAIVLMLVGFIITNILGLIHMQLTWLITLIVLGVIAIIRIFKGWG